MVVFYGSQTGTAEEFAARLGKIKIFRQNASLSWLIFMISRQQFKLV